MRALTLLLTLALLAWISAASPLVRPTRTTPRGHSSVEQTKGRRNFKGGVPTSAPQLTPRKGEYECGGQLCALRPGEVPRGCVGCQYPLGAIPDFNKLIL